MPSCASPRTSFSVSTASNIAHTSRTSCLPNSTYRQQSQVMQRPLSPAPNFPSGRSLSRGVHFGSSGGWRAAQAHPVVQAQHGTHQVPRTHRQTPMTSLPLQQLKAPTEDSHLSEDSDDDADSVETSTNSKVPTLTSGECRLFVPRPVRHTLMADHVDWDRAAHSFGFFPGADYSNLRLSCSARSAFVRRGPPRQSTSLSPRGCPPHANRWHRRTHPQKALL